MSELRSVTFQLEFKGQDGITGMRQFTRVVSDADNAVEALKKELGDTANVTYKTVQSAKEYERQARAVVTASERQASALVRQSKQQEERANALAREYQHLASLQGKSAEQQQVLNAQYRLGANATQEQKERIAALVVENQRLAASMNQTQGSMRDLRGIAQNFGWQLQDTAVQLQMGTNAMIVLTQQGSQMASAFGPTGAIVGAVIAVAGAIGGALLPSLFDSTTALERLDAAAKKTNETLTIGSDGVVEYSDKLTRLAEISGELSRAQLTVAIEEQTRALNKGQQDIQKYLSEMASWYESADDQMVDLIKNQSFYSLETVRNLREQIKAFDGSATSLTNLSAALDETAKLTTNLSDDGVTLVNEMTSLIQKYEDGQVSLKALEDALNDTGIATKALRDDTADLITQLQNQVNTLGFSDQKLAMYEAAQKGATQAQIAEIAALHSKIRAYENEQKAIEGRKKLEEQTERERERAAKKAEADAAKLAKSSERELEKAQQVVDSWVQRADVLGMSARQAALYEAQARAITNADIAQLGTVRELINAYYDKAEAMQIEDQIATLQFKLDPASSIMDKYFTEQELIEEALTRQLITEQQAQALSLAAYEQYTDNIIKLNKSKLKSYEDTSTNFLNLTKAETDNLLGFTTQLGNVTSQLAQIAEEGSAEAKALFYANQAIAFANTIINTEAGATAALGQLGAFGIPMSNLIRATGYASAGIIAGTTFAGAFDDGGYIPSGSSGIVSEYGDELVNGVVVKGPARVTSREDTAAMMGAKVNVYNLPGQTASVTTNVLGETDIRIIAEQVFQNNIDNGVAGVLSNNNSRATKTMNSKYRMGKNR